MLITVVTPTFNRAHTLHRCYESLSKQTLHDFEWLVIDDGSTDGTAELVAGWQKQASFPIRYLHKQNGGKPSAVNAGIRNAYGKYLAILDSDDAVPENSLELLAKNWATVSEFPDADKYWCVLSLCKNAVTGDIVGSQFPENGMAGTWASLTYKVGISGEKWGLMRTDLLREHTYPEDLDVKFITESLVWAALGRKYKYWCTNDVVRDYYVPEGPALGNLSGRANSIRNAAGMLPADIDTLNQDLPWYFVDQPVHFLKRCAQVVRYSLHAGQVKATWDKITASGAMLMLVLAAPVGIALYIRDLLWFKFVYETAKASMARESIS